MKQMRRTKEIEIKWKKERQNGQRMNTEKKNEGTE